MPIISTGNTTGTGLDAPLRHSGEPDSDTYAGTAVVGSLLIDTDNGVLYICTGVDDGEVTWSPVGANGNGDGGGGDG